MPCSNIRVQIRSFVQLLLALLTVAPTLMAATAQPDSTTRPQAAGAVSPPLEPLDRQEVFRRIAIYEDAVREAVAAHAGHETLVKIYVNLGILYEVVDMYPRAETSTRRAIELMKDGPQDQLAEEINRLSIIHTRMGKLRESEEDEMQALAICEKVGDPVGTALTWTQLAALYYKEGRMKKSLEYADKAYSALAQNAKLKVSDRIAVMQVMAFALCGTHACTRAIPVMKEAVAQAESANGEDSLSASLEYYLLGYIYWHCEDTADAAAWMGRGIKRMKVELGWGNSLYVNAMEQYARFLRETGQREAASKAESEIHQIDSVVDARTLTTRGADLLPAGNR